MVISGAQGLLMLMGSNFLIKITRPQYIAPSKRIVSGKNFMAISSMVYTVGMTKDLALFLVILLSITPSNPA